MVDYDFIIGTRVNKPYTQIKEICDALEELGYEITIAFNGDICLKYEGDEKDAKETN